MENATSTLSLRDRNGASSRSQSNPSNRGPYTGNTGNKKHYGHGKGSRRFDNSKPELNKATYAHENHLNELLNKPIIVVYPDAQERYERLIGYDAFSITVEAVTDDKSPKAKVTIFKNQVLGFMSGEQVGE